MRALVKSAMFRGVEAVPVDVEATVYNGSTPGLRIVGMTDVAALESGERVRAALKSSGFSLCQGKVLVSLAPGSIRKSGTGFDLAIAVAYLIATNQIDPCSADGRMFVGELSLGGDVMAAPGGLAYAVESRRAGLALVCAASACDIPPIDGLSLVGVESLSDLRDGRCREVRSCAGDSAEPRPVDFGDVHGNGAAKRACQIAAAGGHNLLFVGPSGSGKAMMARRLPTIMAPFEDEGRLAAAIVHSVTGLDPREALSGTRPFRSPHHSATSSGLIGGGSPVRPGEASLAHGGVLFLDDLPEFRPSVLQMLRQPIETGEVVIARGDGVVRFPADFLLVGAAAPCPCGHYGDPSRDCTCSPAQIARYQSRIAGPLSDRIDIWVETAGAGSAAEPSSHLCEGADSRELRDGVVAAREFAAWRLAREASNPLDAVRALDDEPRLFLEHLARARHMSGRDIVVTASLARTIADLAQRQSISSEDLLEAAALRRIRD